MDPISSYLKNLFAQNRILGKDTSLKGLAKADGLLADLVNEKKVPGLSITVLKEGEILLQKGYGHANLEQKKSVDPSRTIFRIASISKPITATALAHMVSENSIDLDASFYDYVPYFPRKRWEFSIRELAGHTAGIRGYRGKEFALNKPYSIKESIKIFQDDPLVFEPGKGYLYNSFDFVLLSLAMQEACGRPFENYVLEKVLEPLGMSYTVPERVTEQSRSDRHSKVFSTKGSQDLVAGRSRSYTRFRSDFRKAVPVNNFYKLAGGGYLSTSADIAKLGQAYLDGSILDTEILSQFLTSQTVKGKPTYYGLGWQVSEDTQGRKFYGHIGNSVGAYSNFFVYPGERMVFSILINCTNPKIQRELDGVVDTLFVRPELQKP